MRVIQIEYGRFLTTQSEEEFSKLVLALTSARLVETSYVEGYLAVGTAPYTFEVMNLKEPNDDDSPAS